jgi:hypothetical protein
VPVRVLRMLRAMVLAVRSLGRRRVDEHACNDPYCRYCRTLGEDGIG